MKYTKLLLIFISLLLITSCSGKTHTVEDMEFFEYIKFADTAEVSFGDNMYVADELLEELLKTDRSDVAEMDGPKSGAEESGEQAFILDLYRDHSELIYRMQFYDDGSDNILGDKLEVHAYKYMTTGEPEEGYFEITDKEVIEELEEICEELYEMQAGDE